MRIKFRFRWIPFVATCVVVALGCKLGQWQLHRAAYKEAIDARMNARQTEAPIALGAATVDPDSLEYRRVTVVGQFVRDWPVYLQNRPYRGVSGFCLLMPLKIKDSNVYVLIARGWIPRDTAHFGSAPTIATPDGTVTIEGLATRNPGRLLQLGHADPIKPHAILLNLKIADFAAASNMTMQPVLIEQSNDLHDNLVRDWPRPSVGIARHYGYAFQWYGLALTALIFFVVTGFRRESKK